jgi:MarR family transcriptional regulator, lower aerobic nicotinate degradation pathway regulator
VIRTPTGGGHGCQDECKDDEGRAGIQSLIQRSARIAARCHALAHVWTGQLYRFVHARIEVRLGEVDQSLRTYYVLVSLSEESGISQQEVCDRIGMDRGDMVRLVDDLEARGQVKRTRDPKDRRRYRLSLTSRGQTARKRCDRILAPTTDEVFSELSSKERRTLHRLILRALGQPTAIADELDTPDADS